MIIYNRIEEIEYTDNDAEKYNNYINHIYSRLDESKDLSEDIAAFRNVNTYLDPCIDTKKDKITFLRIANSNSSDEKIKEKFNKYLNVKYNHVTNPLTYKENMDRFIRHSKIVTTFLDDILKMGKFPKILKQELTECEELRDNPNIFNLMKLYKNSTDKRLRFEILRKIGLIDLVSRIDKNYPLEYTEYVASEVRKLFSIGLSLKKLPEKTCFIWMNEMDKVKYCFSKEKAFQLYELDSEKREEINLVKSPIGEKRYTPYSTSTDNIEILEIRDKLQKDDKPYYTSFLEKMVRKNIEFPNQIHDTIGVRLVVRNPEEIPTCIKYLEKFIGGSSSRKKEKNTLHKFGKIRLSPYSSKDYYVWKAVYDIALPHFTIRYLREIERITTEKRASEIIKKRIDQMIKMPINAVVEVQIQDFESYMLSILEGSPTDHSRLKMNQVRKNSFFKLFPKEIYGDNKMYENKK